METQRNVLGGILKPCCLDPVTGFYRDGYCRIDGYGGGEHLLCAIVTEKFLDFSFKQGNDLYTPDPELRFPGLKPGDKWCLCMARWKEALRFRIAPPLILESCHEKALQYVSLETLMQYALEDACA